MSKYNNKNSNKVMWAFIWIAVGVLWIMSNYGKLPYTFNWGKDWPVVFIIIGIVGLYKFVSYNFFGKSRKNQKEPDCKTTEQRRKQILDAVENNEMSADEAAKKLKEL